MAGQRYLFLHFFLFVIRSEGPFRVQANANSLPTAEKTVVWKSETETTDQQTALGRNIYIYQREGGAKTVILPHLAAAATAALLPLANNFLPDSCRKP